MLSLSYQHEDAMLQTERDFSSQPFAINPAAFTLTGGNPGTFQPTTSDFYNAATITMNALTSLPGINDLPGSTGAAARTACEAIGGQIGNVLQPNSSLGATSSFAGFPNAACAFPQSPFQNLVNENDQYRGYIEFNADMTENMEFHFDANYSKSKT